MSGQSETTTRNKRFLTEGRFCSLQKEKEKKKKCLLIKTSTVLQIIQLVSKSSGSYQGTMVLDFDYECDTLYIDETL